MISVTITRQALENAGACERGLELFDAVVRLGACDPHAAGVQLHYANWTPLHSAMLLSSVPGFHNWLVTFDFIPVPDLIDCDLRDLDLSFADLSELDIHGADFSGASLVNVDFSGSKLTSCRFVDADLGGACLSGTDTSGADFTGALVWRENDVPRGWEITPITGRCSELYTLRRKDTSDAH